MPVVPLVFGLFVAASGVANPIETPHLAVRLSVSPATAAPGSRVSLIVDVVPKRGMHVYAPGQKTYIPVTIALEPNNAVRVRKTIFPKPESYFFAPLSETQLVYSKPFRIVQDVTMASAAVLKEARRTADARVMIAGTLRYQACDDAICYLPKEVPVAWTIALRETSMR